MKNEKQLKSFSMREKKERKTIADGSDVLESIESALIGGKSAYGFTMGNVSLIQIVEMICEKFGGNFDFTTCVWSANHVDIARLASLKDNGFIAKARFIVDPSAYTRKYDAIESLYLSFGIEAVRTMPTHAKFVTLKNEKHEIVITSSMNFTHNPRIEQYEVVECPETLALMENVVDSSFSMYESCDNFTGQAMSKFKKIKDAIKDRDESDIFDFDLDLDLLCEEF